MFVVTIYGADRFIFGEWSFFFVRPFVVDIVQNADGAAHSAGVYMPHDKHDKQHTSVRARVVCVLPLIRKRQRSAITSFAFNDYDQRTGARN